MTRFGFFQFHFLLVFSIYGLIWISTGSKPDEIGHRLAALSYMLWNFTIPYLLIILLMVLISTIRWFMSHDPDIASEIVCWANALWAMPLFTAIILYLMGGISGNFWPGLRHLMTGH